MKHLVDIITSPNMSIAEFEISCAVMWAFTTPLMLQIYCNANCITFKDINASYHFSFIIPHIFVVPLKTHFIYFIISVVSFFPAALFMKALHKYRHLPFTNFYMVIWTTFFLINLLDISHLFNPSVIHSLYNIANTLCKYVCVVIISNYTEQEHILRESMDLQSVNFVSGIIKHITKFEKEKPKIVAVFAKT
jgi:hypothetical protein